MADGQAPDEHEDAIENFDRRQLDRLIFFSDGVFAIAITLLVLDLKLPEDSGGVVDFMALEPKLFAFVLSFAVIGGYWLLHRVIFRRVVRENPAVLLLNLLFLLAIVFLPFASSVIAEFPVTSSSVMLYALSVAAVGAVSTALSFTTRSLTAPGTPHLPTAVLLARSFTAPAMFLISAVIAPRDPHLAVRLWWWTGPVVWVVSMLARVLTGRPVKG